MFDQFKAMGAIAGLLKDKERVRAAMERFREKIERMRVTGTAGGGAVRVVVNGKMIAEEVTLDPALVAGLTVGDGGRAMAQALIREAMNDAVSRAQSLVQEEANREAQALGLPGLPGLGSLLN